MADIFETKAKMPVDPSPDVVRARLAEPESECFAQVPGLCKHDNHIQHAPIPRIGAKG